METTKHSTATLNHFSAVILDSAITVHKTMGPGLLESVYQHCMINELRSRDLYVSSKVQVPLFYKGTELNKDYVIDVLVEEEIILELKSVEGILPVHKAQLLSYLRLTNFRLGFLINFNVALLKQGFHRFVHNF